MIDVVQAIIGKDARHAAQEVRAVCSLAALKWIRFWSTSFFVDWASGKRM